MHKARTAGSQNSWATEQPVARSGPVTRVISFDVSTPAALAPPRPASLAISGSIRGQCGQPACRCAHRDVIDFTFISIGARQDRPASGTKCADGESVVDPIDYFMAIFTGMCIGLAGMAYFWS